MGVTKLYRLVSEVLKTSTYSVKGYQSAKLSVDIDSIDGSLTFGIYADADDASAATSRPTVIMDGVKQLSNIELKQTGHYDIDIDLTYSGSLRIVKVVSGTVTDKTVLSCFYDKFVSTEVIENIPDNFIKGGDTKTISVPVGAKQADIKINSVSAPEGSNIYVYIKGTTDGVTYNNIPFYDNTQDELNINGYFPVSSEFERVLWLNVEEYSSIQIFFRSSKTTDFIESSINFSDVYKDRTITPVKDNANKGFNHYKYQLLKGYRYVILNISAELSFSDAYIVCAPVKNVGTYDASINRKLRNLYGVDVTDLVPITNGVPFNATVYNGSIIVESDFEPNTWHFNAVIQDSGVDGYKCNANVKATMTNSPSYLQYDIIKKTNDYIIKRQPSKSPNRDIYNKSAIEWIASSVTFYPYGYGCFEYNIPLNSTTCPDWGVDESIEFVSLLPFDIKGQGYVSVNGRGLPRICIFTNKGRILHNYPLRYSAGIAMKVLRSDMAIFDESIVVENKNTLKWLPTNEKSKATGIYRYFPVLTNYNYNQFDGRFKNWGRTETYNTQVEFPSNTLYHQKNENYGQWRRLNYGNLAKDDKVCVFANYNGYAGQEPVIIATNNGGQRWDILSKFACVEHYQDMHAGDIDMSKIGGYTANSIKLCRCTFNIPSDNLKEPTTAFTVPENQQSLIVSMSTSGGVTTIITADDLTFDEAESPRVFLQNVSAAGDWSYVCNNDPLDNNNGIFFRAIRTSAKTYTLKADLGDSYQSDRICRHMHNISRTSNGFLICTGESYIKEKFQGGFLYFITQNKRDGYTTVSTSYGDLINPSSLVRLTSSPNGVIRACGAYMFCDDVDPTILYVSDEPNYLGYDSRDAKLPEGRSQKLNIVPIGIFVGKLSEIDNQSSYRCVLDTRGMITSLIHNMGHFMADGFNNSIYLSKNGFNWVEYENSGDTVNGTDLEGRIYFGIYCVEFI